MSDDNQVDDVEGGKAKAQAKAIPHFRQVLDQAGVTADVEQWKYEGSGTEEDPFVVVWIDHDPRNPMLYSQLKKWTLTMLVALATLAVAFVSSAFSGGTEEIASDFGASEEVVTLGLSLFVLVSTATATAAATASETHTYTDRFCPRASPSVLSCGLHSLSCLDGSTCTSEPTWD